MLTWYAQLHLHSPAFISSTFCVYMGKGGGAEGKSLQEYILRDDAALGTEYGRAIAARSSPAEVDAYILGLFDEESEALDAAHVHGVAQGVNLSWSRALLLDAFSPLRLRSLEAAHANHYRLADPFPHVTFEGLLPEAVLSAVAAELPEAYNDRGCVQGTKFCISQKISGGSLVQPPGKSAPVGTAYEPEPPATTSVGKLKADGTVAWERNGAQSSSQSEWLSSIAYLSSVSFKFRGTRGASHLGDLAVDTVRVACASG